MQVGGAAGPLPRIHRGPQGHRPLLEQDAVHRQVGVAGFPESGRDRIESILILRVRHGEAEPEGPVPAGGPPLGLHPPQRFEGFPVHDRAANAEGAGERPGLSRPVRHLRIQPKGDLEVPVLYRFEGRRQNAMPLGPDPQADRDGRQSHTGPALHLEAGGRVPGALRDDLGTQPDPGPNIPHGKDHIGAACAPQDRAQEKEDRPHGDIVASARARKHPDGLP